MKAKDMRQTCGFGLIEALISLALFSVVFAAALGAFAGARRLLVTSDRLAELQQAVRVAADRLGTDVASAGLAVRSEGAPGGVDEAIEGAWEGAIVVRGDLDGRTADATDPEKALASATANDEIVAYVLAPPEGAGPQSIGFAADVKGVPRDGMVEPVVIDGIVLDPVDPPYTLYRVTVKPNSTGTVRSPVVDGVMRLRFEYFDRDGGAIVPLGGTESSAARGARAAIRRVRVSIEGLTRDEFPTWSDPHDPDPSTRHHRKFGLVFDLVARNLELPSS